MPPSITSTSGSQAHAATLTINGSGFGTKSPAIPYFWADFEQGNGNPTTLGTKTAFDGGNLVYTTTNARVNSTGALMNATYLGGSFDAEMELQHATSFDTLYCYCKRYFDFDMTGNQKF